MFIQKKDFSVVCTTCNVRVKTVEQHLIDKHSDDPEWFFESWDGQEQYMYICTKCGNEDYPSDSEIWDDDESK